MCHATRRVNRQARGPAVVLDGVYLDDSGHCLAHQKSAELRFVIYVVAAISSRRFIRTSTTSLASNLNTALAVKFS